jgi:hypothetical protein
MSQACVLTGAVDALVGRGGAIRAALEENHAYWRIPTQVIDRRP